MYEHNDPWNVSHKDIHLNASGMFVVLVCVILRSGTGSQYRNGTCLTSAECSQKGGSSGGDCAGGFGVCCVFMTSTCGATVSQNCSYIKNPNFPSAYTSTTSCTFTINKCDPCK